MKNTIAVISKSFKNLSAFFILALFIVLGSSCNKSYEIQDRSVDEEASNSPKLLKDFEQVNLVANVAGYDAGRIDPNLVNGWGIAFSPGGIPWIAAQGTGLSLVYNQFGADVRPPVAIPSPGGPTGGNPTGVVFNGSADFVLSNGSAARFIFVGVDGIISGWNPAAGNNALVIKNNSATSAYTGLAIASSAGNNYIYASDFRSGKIDVYDKNFAAVIMPFSDPDLPAGYSPFNIQAIGDKLYVMYAKVGPDGRDEASPGNGYVDIFNTDGTLVNRFVSRGQLNAPWGVAKAPAGFWGEQTDNPEDVILIGNFGDGRINAYGADGSFLGQLREHGEPIVIDGLWAITFAPVAATSIDPGKLFFAAGPNHELDGLFGYIHK